MLLMPFGVDAMLPGWAQRALAGVLLLAAALQAGSEHPLARAVLTRVGTLAVPQARDVTALPGRGIQDRVDGRPVMLGSVRLMTEHGADITAA